jgi:3-hydroxyisobutyrate dehydrogenase
VVEGPGGLIGRSGPATLVVDMGSSLPAETRRLAAAAAGRGAAFLDAPVSGGVAKARDGTLAIMLGGEDAPCARAEPFCARWGAADPHRPGRQRPRHEGAQQLRLRRRAAGRAEAVHMADALGLDTACSPTC